MGGLHKCGRTMKCICPPYPFGAGITYSPFWRGRSSPPCTFTFFVRTGICVGCGGGAASVKIARPHPPPEVATTITGIIKVA